MINHLRSSLEECRTGIAFLYCDYRDQDGQNLAKMIGSLAKQLLRQVTSVPDEIQEIYKENLKENQPMTIENGQEILSLAIREFNLVYICIDAIDECEPEVRSQFLRFLKPLSSTSIHIFLTGRPNVEAEVTGVLVNFSPKTVPIMAKDEDIRTFLSQKISGDRYDYLDIMDEKLKAEIIEKIATRSRGMYVSIVTYLKVLTIL